MKRMLTRSGGTWKLGGVAALALAAGCGTPEPEVSWHKDVSPIMQEHCTRCHAPDGLGIGDFTDLDNVRTFSGRIEARIDEGSMPPATSDPECRDYLGSEHLNLPEAKKDVFRRWVELEMPEGDPELAPELDLPADTLEDADLVLQPPELVRALEGVHDLIPRTLDRLLGLPEDLLHDLRHRDRSDVSQSSWES